MSCDVGKAAEVLESEMLCRWSAHDVGEATERLRLILQPLHRFTYVIVHSPTLPPLYLRHSSFYSPSVASPTSHLTLQPFRRFIYATAHSSTLPLLQLRHRSFYTAYVDSPMSQALHVLHLASRPCKGGWKNSLWWTSLLLQVTEFRSSYSFG